MKTIELELSELIPYENNPRRNDEAVDKVALSISAFGFKVPIVIDKNNVIVTGHTRFKAAKKLGLTTVPCIMADDLTDEQIKAFRLADNKVAEFSQWDEEKLMKELEELGEVDMSLYGFNFPEDEDEEEEFDDTYTDKTNIPQYDITGEVPEISELVDEEKTNELLEEIENSDLRFRSVWVEDIVFSVEKLKLGKRILSSTMISQEMPSLDSVNKHQTGGMREAYSNSSNWVTAYVPLITAPDCCKVNFKDGLWKTTKKNNNLMVKIISERWKK